MRTKVLFEVDIDHDGSLIEGLIVGVERHSFAKHSKFDDTTGAITYAILNACIDTEGVTHWQVSNIAIMQNLTGLVGSQYLGIHLGERDHRGKKVVKHNQ